MSYCVNCGVELDASAKECPLCNTPVINPADLEKIRQDRQPFPTQKGSVETVKRKDLGILVSMVALATAATCGILNAFVFPGNLWSLAVIGVCAILWVILIPVFIYVRQPIYVSILFDGLAVAGYLYLLTFLTGTREWFVQLGVPIVLLVTAVAEAAAVCICRLPRSFLTVALYLFTASGLLCLGLEILIDRYVGGQVSLSWSAVVLTVTAILDIAIVTMLSRRRLRNAVRKRLHF
ncbi:MAG: DUF6320 domain-containing protein [bacterium]|nr:DUF6320 domain-containing protein [bacterium]